jgi:hypothetical protein
MVVNAPILVNAPIVVNSPTRLFSLPSLDLIFTSPRPFPATVFEMLENHITQHAAYNSYERESEGAFICKENTRVAVLEKVMAWAQAQNGRPRTPVCWLHGPAGSGKSTIAHTLSQRYDEQGRLAFSFFFSRRNLDRNDATKFVLTFAYQLAAALPSVTQAMRDALVRNPSILRQRLKDQFAKLIIDPLQSTEHNVPPMLVVIDGLDECRDEGHVNELIQLLVPALSQFPFRLLFTSRPEAYIQAIFARRGIVENARVIALRDFNAYHDVRKYLRSHLSNVQIARGLPVSWPSHADLDQLARQSEGIFIYASTLVKFVNDEYDDPQRRLQIALNAHNGLDTLFDQVLGNAKKYLNFELALGAVLFTRDNPNINILPQLLQLNSVYDVRLALRGCLSILLVPEDDDDYIRPYHASLQDFLTDCNRGGDRFLDPVKCNMSIVDGCIQLMTSNSTSNASICYAYRHWGHHFYSSLYYAKDLDHIQSSFGLRVEQLLKYLLQQQNTWFCRLFGVTAVKRVLGDLNSSLKCVMVRVELYPYHNHVHK